MSFQGMEAFLINTTDRRTQGVCRCEVAQCRSHVKNKGTQLNDWPQPKESPTSLSQFFSDVLKMVIQIISNHDNCYTMLYIS